MSNYLKNVLVGFARPTTATAEKVVLALNNQTSDQFPIFYPGQVKEQTKTQKDQKKNCQRKSSAAQQQRLHYPMTTYQAILEDAKPERPIFHTQMPSFTPVNTSQINNAAQPYFYMAPQHSFQPTQFGERLTITADDKATVNLNPHARVFKATPRNDKIDHSQIQHKTDNLAQKYFESEQEAQLWEEQLGCLESPAPQQFLDECDIRTKASQSKTKKTQRQLGKVIKTKQPQIDAQGAFKPVEGFKMKFKTEICKFWQNSGTCEYSDSCSFAHGSHELQQKIDLHKNYKTKQCKRFHKDLYCPYGSRCQFLHGEAGIEKAVKKTQKYNSAISEAAGPAYGEETELLKETPISYKRLLDDVVLTEEKLFSGSKSSRRRLTCFESIPLSSSRSSSQVSLS